MTRTHYGPSLIERARWGIGSIVFRLRWRLPKPGTPHDSEDWNPYRDEPHPCGEWLPGHGTALCARHRRYYEHSYPQGWAYYPGDVCRHGAYVGGCGPDLICGPCEWGDD